MTLNPTTKRPTLTQAIENGPTREQAKDVQLRDLVDNLPSKFVPPPPADDAPRSDFHTMQVNVPRQVCSNTLRFAALDAVKSAQASVEQAIRDDVTAQITHCNGYANLKTIERYLNRATRALRRMNDARHDMMDALDEARQ